MKKNNWLKETTDIDAFTKSDKFWEHLSEHAYPLSKGEMRIPISLEPYVLSEEKYVELHDQIELLISAAKKLAEHYYDDPELAEVFAIDELERTLILQSKDEPLIGIVRVDLFHGNIPKLVEINADFPDGFFMHDVTSSAIKNMITSQELHHASNTDLFAELLKSENVQADDHIFVGYNGNRLFLDEFALTMIKLNERGWHNISIGAFEDLHFEDGTCYFQDKPVNVIRRGAELSKLREMPGFFENLALAQKTSGLKIINNFKMRLLGHKSLLAALHDERFTKYLTKGELVAIKTLVPLTRKLNTNDERLILSEKDRWVLKPSDLAEGHGVSIGTSLSQDEWERAVRTALTAPHKWILQEKIRIPSEVFTILNEATRERAHSEAYYDFDPHIVLFRDKSKFGNVLVRFSESEILNVMQGGGLTYAFYEKNKLK